VEEKNCNCAENFSLPGYVHPWSPLPHYSSHIRWIHCPTMKPAVGWPCQVMLLP